MSIREGRVALSVGHPPGTHSRYVIGCCLIPLGICGLKNNSRRITYGIGCVWEMPSLPPLSSLGKGLLHLISVPAPVEDLPFLLPLKIGENCIHP